MHDFRIEDLLGSLTSWMVFGNKLDIVHLGGHYMKISLIEMLHRKKDKNSKTEWGNLQNNEFRQNRL